MSPQSSDRIDPISFDLYERDFPAFTQALGEEGAGLRQGGVHLILGHAVIGNHRKSPSRITVAQRLGEGGEVALVEVERDRVDAVRGLRAHG